MSQKTAKRQRQTAGAVAITVAEDVANAIRSSGAPVKPGQVGIDWSGAIIYSVGLTTQARIDQRTLYDALVGDAMPKKAARGAIDDMARELGSTLPRLLRNAADHVERSIKAAAKKRKPSGLIIT